MTNNDTSNESKPMPVKEQLIEIEAKIKSIQIDQDNLAMKKTFDHGGWKTKTAEKQFDKMEREIEKLDETYDALLEQL